MASIQQKLPVIFSFNVLSNVYRQFGVSHFEQIQAMFEKQNIQAEFLPIITNEKDTIENRAQQIQKNIESVYQKLNTDKAHIVSYSGSGLDYRYFISELGGNKSIQSLTTIATPHRGSFLAEEFMGGKIAPALIEPISRLVGMSSYSFSELNTDNIESFNTSIFNDSNIKYFSIGGERNPNHSQDALRPTGQHIFENKEDQESDRLSSYEKYKGRQQQNIEEISIDSDGIFCSNEIQWGTHLINFEADHAELVGIPGNQFFDSNKVFGLISDNLKHNFE